MKNFKSERFFSDISAFLKESSHDRAEELSALIAEKFPWYFWRVTVYIPTASKAQQFERAKSILAKFKSNNHSELALEHGVSVQTVYKIIKSKGIKSDPSKTAFFEFMDDVLPVELARSGVIGADEAVSLCSNLKQFIMSRYSGCSLGMPHSSKPYPEIKHSTNQSHAN